MDLKSKKDVLSIQKNGSYTLSNDIDMENIVVKRLVDDFRGTIDGRGHTIKNITISSEAEFDGQGIALFNSMFRAVIQNLTFENLMFEIKENGYSVNIASLCVVCENSSLENVKVYHNGKLDVPMIFESNSSSYSNCISTGSMHEKKLIRFSYRDHIE